jgi:hypothetical protein
MKHQVIGGIIACVLTALDPQITQAQGTLYVSSLSSNSTGSASVGSDSWLAAGFETGNNPGGYLLNSIQLGMADASGNPSGFTVMLFSEVHIIGALVPGSGLGTLTGSVDPTEAGTYSYTAPSLLMLSALTDYYIVLSSATTTANGAYSWNESTYPPGVNDWGGVGNGILQSSNGTSGWSPTSYLGIAQFTIYATPSPEPGVLGLFALGGLLFGFWRWKARAFNS